MTGRLGGGVRRSRGLLLGLVLLSGALAGCGGEDSPAAPATTAAGGGTVTTADDGVQEITLQTRDDFTFTPDRFTVDPGRVRLTVVNVAEQMTHNLEFVTGDGPEEIAQGISILAPGEEKTIEFAVEAPGDHPFECSFHVPQGQVGTMTVRG